MSDDLEVIAPGPLVTVAGLAIAAAGIMQSAAGYQLVDMVYTAWWWADIWMWLVLLTGLPLIPVGFGFTTARMWALIPAIPLTVLAGLTSFGWVVFTVINSGFTLATVAAAGFCFMGAVLGLVASPRAFRVAKARRDLIKSI